MIFFSRTDPSLLTSIAPLLLDWSNETSWIFSALKSTSHFLPQSTDTEERGDWLKVTNNIVLIDYHTVIPSNFRNKYYIHYTLLTKASTTCALKPNKSFTGQVWTMTFVTFDRYTPLVITLYLAKQRNSWHLHLLMIGHFKR